MFNWPNGVIGMAVNHHITTVHVNWRKKLLNKARCDATDAMIHHGEVVNAELLLKNIGWHAHGKSLALAIDDNWLEQQTFATHHANKKALDYLIKQKISPGNRYDYHLHSGQCTLWQLSKNRYASYQQLAKKMGLTLKSIEPESSAKIRLFTQPLPQPYGIYYQSVLYVIDHDKIVFSHQVLNHDIEHAAQLFESLQQQKITQLIQPPERKEDIDPEFLTAYAAAVNLARFPP